MKKIILLSFLITTILTLFSICYAGSFYDILDTKYEGIVEGLAFLKIVDGVGDNIFDANKTVTRAELAKMLVLAHGYEKYADLLDAPKAFKDVKSNAWYYDYVNIATAYGFINGYPDGKFYPDREVTYSETVAMILRSLGHKYIREDSEYGWDFNYIQRMRELKLNKGMEVFSNSDGAKRGEVAILIWNMLNGNMWDVIEEEGSGNLTYSDSGKTVIDRAFSKEYQSISGKKIKGFSAFRKTMYARIEGLGEVELANILPFYALGSKVEGIYNKKEKIAVVVEFDSDIKIVDGRPDEIKEDGYKIKDIKDKYYIGGKSDDYYLLAVRKEGTETIIERAIILDLGKKIKVDKTEKEKDILTINEEYEIDTRDAILLDGKTQVEWSELTKKDSILAVVAGKIYIIANNYKSEDDILDEYDEDDEYGNLYYISDISYNTNEQPYIGLVSNVKSTHYYCTADIKDIEVGDLVIVTIEKNKITKLEIATEKKYEDLEIGKNLILNYKNKTYARGMIGKYVVDESTKIYILNKKYMNNSNTTFDKCFLEKTGPEEFDYVEDETINLIVSGAHAKVVYIERETNKFDAFYARVKDVYTEKETLKLVISPADDPIVTYETTGIVNCSPGDIISYTLSDKDVLKIDEVYRSSVIGYEGDLVVNGAVNKMITLTNGESFNQSDNTIFVNGRRYRISDYIVISAKVRKSEGNWVFSSMTFTEWSKFKFSQGDRMAIDEIEGVIIIYSGYTD